MAAAAAHPHRRRAKPLEDRRRGGEGEGAEVRDQAQHAQRHVGRYTRSKYARRGEEQERGGSGTAQRGEDYARSEIPHTGAGRICGPLKSWRRPRALQSWRQALHPRQASHPTLRPRRPPLPERSCLSSWSFWAGASGAARRRLSPPLSPAWPLPAPGPGLRDTRTSACVPGASV